MDKIVKALGILVLAVVISIVQIGVITLCAHDLWRVYLDSWGGGPSYEEWAGVSFLIFLVLPNGASTGVKAKNWTLTASLITFPVVTWLLGRAVHMVLW